MTRHALPSQPTPFIGRDAELAEVADAVADTTCRLLTVVGPGGVGKTRLAIEAASRTADVFADGICFVELQPVEAAGLLSAIADALPIVLSGRGDPQTQLVSYLDGKEMLLLLDSFEHLQEKATFIGKLLVQAPSVTLLVTSRVALNLRQERLYPLHGLPVPPEAAEEVAAYGAAQLFLERAVRVRPDLSLGDEWRGVARICHLVEGNPLALELAASWTKVLSCAEIAEEIERNIDFLSTSLRDIPRRHRSMQAVFEQSWQLLTQEERKVFRRLSVFRGGFRRDAAEAVAGASLSVLSTLLDKSLLRREADDRYAIHGLLRQYGEEKLAHAPSEDVDHIVDHIRDLHCTYYLAFLAERSADIRGGRQLGAAAEIGAELDNVRAAWKRGVAQAKIAKITDAAYPLYYFCQFGSRYREGAEMFEQAAQLLDDDTVSAEPKTVLVLTCLGWFYMRLGRFEEAKGLFARGHAVFRQLDEPLAMPYAFDPSLGLGLLASMRGEHGEAKRLLGQALDRSRRHEHLVNQEAAHCFLAELHLAQGQSVKAEHHAQAAYTTAQALQERWFMAYCLNALGNAAVARGDYAAATKHYQASYAIREEFDDAEGMAVALNHLGEVALQREEVDEAQQFFQKSVDAYRRTDDRGGLATALHGSGKTALARNDLETARQTLQRALEIADKIQFVSLVLGIIVSAAELLVKWGASETAFAWLDFVQQHATADHDVKTRAEQVRGQSAGELAAGPEAAPAEDQGWTLPEVIAEVQAELAIHAGEEARRGRGEEGQSLAKPSSRRSALVEPLTKREQEVLQLLAQGLTNREIAAELTIVVGTVKAHNHHIYGKLGVDNRVEAVTRARELGLI